MFRRTLVLVFALTLIAPALAQAEPARVQPPIQTEGLEVEASAASVMLEEGSTSLAASARSGSLVVWEKRTPCFEKDPNRCLEGQAETSRTKSSLEAASLTIQPRSDHAHVTVLSLADEGRFSLSADQADLQIRSSAQTVHLTEDEEAPSDVGEAKLPQGLDIPVEGADVTLSGSLSLQTIDSTVRIEPNASDQEAREIVTGVSWEEGEDRFYYRTLRLAKADFTGGLTSPWDGSLLATPLLPAPFTAASAEVNVTDGQLGPANASTSPTQVDDIDATIAGIHWQDEGGQLIVEEGRQPVAAAQDAPADEGVSRTTVLGAGSAAAVAVLFTAYYWPRISWLGTVFVLPLYSRIEKDELFENETREELYEQIQEDPGIHAHALADEVDIGWGTTVYHLRRLERNGFVNSEKRGRYRRFFPASGFVERQREVLSVLQNETTNDIAALVREQPGLNQSAICDELDISPSLANWHLNRLIDAELVERERRGRTVHYTPGEAWEALETAADVEAHEVLGDAQAA